MEFNIKDGGGKRIGVAQVRTSGSVLMEGSFSPSPHFETYAALFQAHEAARRANEPAAESADDPEAESADDPAKDASSRHDSRTLQDDIDGHGFTAEGPLPLPGSARIHDLRISGSGTNLRICFRFAPPTTANAPADA
ncbi:hypothetical protein [Achromobacter kerstersii]|uniref:hypothetical protein n=1 Tax=Achromobacter kerstersii TaxID=1353890 RepID=UPI00313B0974